MARNAISILGDEQTLLKFKQQALSHARTFDIKEILPLYEDLYNKVIAESNR